MEVADLDRAPGHQGSSEDCPPHSGDADRNPARDCRPSSGEPRTEGGRSGNGECPGCLWALSVSGATFSDTLNVSAFPLGPRAERRTARTVSSSWLGLGTLVPANRQRAAARGLSARPSGQECARQEALSEARFPIRRQITDLEERALDESEELAFGRFPSVRFVAPLLHRGLTGGH